MIISEIKNRFPRSRFYKLREEPQKEFLKLDCIDDIMNLTSKVGYFEETISPEDASRLSCETVVQVYSKTLSFAERVKFNAFVHDYMSPQLEELCRCSGYTSVRLYGLDIDVMYDDEECGLDEVDIVLVNKELDRLYRMYCEKKENDTRVREQEIANLIDSYKAKYKQATSNKDREDIIKTVQLSLREKFGLDGRTDSRYTKLSLRLLYESTF